MTFKTGIREDGSNITIEVDGFERHGADQEGYGEESFHGHLIEPMKNERDLMGIRTKGPHVQDTLRTLSDKSCNFSFRTPGH